MAKFKIDLREHSTTFPFSLCVERVGWFWTEWKEVQYAQTREELKSYYEKIKDLPEYL